MKLTKTQQAILSELESEKGSITFSVCDGNKRRYNAINKLIKEGMILVTHKEERMRWSVGGKMAKVPYYLKTVEVNPNYKPKTNKLNSRDKLAIALGNYDYSGSHILSFEEKQIIEQYVIDKRCQAETARTVGTGMSVNTLRRKIEYLIEICTGLKEGTIS